jgi:isoleucyl-tRNA synthetase
VNKAIHPNNPPPSKQNGKLALPTQQDFIRTIAERFSKFPLMPFRDLNKGESFARIEERILSLWGRDSSFEKCLEKEGKPFSFYDGPPFATGLPHYGHLLAGTIKDIVPRYWTMKGCKVPRRFGWDCHGLPIESIIQSQLNLAGIEEIQKYGIDKFNEACRGTVLKYTGEWRKTVRRMGRWVDFDSVSLLAKA